MKILYEERNKLNNNRGFTLIELSIVITIIGLIIAGIITGASLLNQGSLRATMADVNKYRAASYSFYNQYGFYPGDFPNATSYWGAGNTNNGDGNGLIAHNSNEDINAWQHLYLAKMINFTPTLGPQVYGSQTVSSLQALMPTTKHGATRFLIYNPIPIVFGRAYRSIHAGEVYSCCGSARMWGSAFTPVESQTLDTKFDDGTPNKGKIVTFEGDDNATRGVDCVTADWMSATQATSVSYRTTNTTKKCRIDFVF